MTLLILACASSMRAADTGEAADARTEAEAWTPTPAPDPGAAMLTPLIEVPPYSTVLECYYGTYSGPDVGVVYMYPETNAPEFSHHNQLKAVSDDEYPDGTMIPCPEGAGGMQSNYTPLFEGVGVTPETVDKDWLELPEGIAMRLSSGQRWVVDTHFVNSGKETLWARSAISLGFVAVDEVEQWASAYQFDAGGLAIPPGADYTTTFGCEFGTDVHVLSLMGHMHGLGSSYRVDLTVGSNVSTVYDVNPWKPEYRDTPIIENYAADAFPAAAHDVFTTTCAWHNETDDTLGYPDEMCTTVGVAYPLEAPVTCFGGNVEISRRP